MDIKDIYYFDFLLPYLKGKINNEHDQETIDQFNFFLHKEEKDQLIDFVKKQDIKIYPFKKRNLPRVREILKNLKGLDGSTVLDVGTGRGTALWTILSEFKPKAITCVDSSKKSIQRLLYVASEHKYITPICVDIKDIELTNKYDVVLALEVLEHIDNFEEAFNVIYNVSNKFIFISVPSKPDDNPEHINLITEDFFLRRKANFKNLQFSYVNGHMIVKIKK